MHLLPLQHAFSVLEADRHDTGSRSLAGQRLPQPKLRCLPVLQAGSCQTCWQHAGSSGEASQQVSHLPAV